MHRYANKLPYKLYVYILNIMVFIDKTKFISNMKRKSLTFLIVIFSIVALCSFNVSEQKPVESYNIKRAIELISEKQLTEAERYLADEISTNPKCAAAYDLLSIIKLREGKPGEALSYSDKAINLYSKKDKEGMSMAYYHRAGAFVHIEDTANAINDYLMAIKINDSFDKALIELADIYFYCKRYEESDKTYKKLSELDRGNAMAYYGLARNAYNQNLYDKAIELISFSRKLDPKSSTPDRLMMRLHYRKHEFEKTLDFCIKVLNQDEYDEEGYYTLIELSDSIPETVFSRINKEVIMNNEKADYWKFHKAHAYMNSHDYTKAVDVLEKLYESQDVNIQSLTWLLANCYEELDIPEKVIPLMDMAIENDPSDADYFIKRADAKFYTRDLAGAVEDFEKYLSLTKEDAYWIYYRLGWIKEIEKDYAGALELYNTSIDLNPDYSYIYMQKGNLLKTFLNDTIAAKDCFLKVLEIEKGIDDNMCKHYAYVGLGDYTKAIEVTDSLLAMFPTPGNHYDAACVYGRMGNAEKAMQYFKMALEKGYLKLNHIEQDDDLDLIKSTEEYKTLMEKYWKQLNELLHKEDANKTKEMNVYEIPINATSGGTYNLTCEVNDLAMSFTLDTGCSDVSLSSVESQFMLKNGYLTEKDLKGKSYYINATGERHESQIVILREIKLGDFVLKNVRASIVPNQKAPLLLGQNVLNKFGTMEIDNDRKLLILKSYK